MKMLHEIEEEIEKQKALLEQLISEHKEVYESERLRHLFEVRIEVDKYKFTAVELGISAKSSKSKSKPKTPKKITFKDDKGNFWDGDLKQQGRKPRWILDAVADGTIEKYRIK